MRTKLLVIFCLLAAAVVSAGAASTPRTPVFFVNEKLRLAQVAEKQRVYIRYDVREVGAAGLKLYLYHHGDDLTGEPRKSWHLNKPEGRERISLNDMPIAVYRIYGVAVDAAGNPVASPSHVVNIEYGGWLAWEAYRNANAEDEAPAFTELPPKSDAGAGNLRVQIVPGAVVMNPQEVMEFQAVLTGMPADDPLQWKIAGDGDHGVLEVKGNHVLYIAPEILGTKLLRLEATSVRNPEVKGGATMLITSMPKDQFE